MPELPEVETVRRGLAHACIEKKITSVHILHPRATNPRSLAALDSVTGATIKNINRRGKFLWFELDRPLALVAHLGMSGQFRIQENQSLDIGNEKHLRARFTLKNPGRSKGQVELQFIDQRTFGWLAVAQYSGETPELVSKIALDLFDPQFDRHAIISKFRARRSEIKRALLDQSLMSGIGNIYADESLWRAKIHPQSVANELSVRTIGKLLDAAKAVMSQALVEGGTSFDSLYVNVNGESGYFDRSLEVYGREHERCSRCGGEIRRIAFAGRSSHFCPRCQRL